VDEQEIKRGSVSTVETLHDYARRFPQAEMSYLIGADNVASLPKWRERRPNSRLGVRRHSSSGSVAGVVPPRFADGCSGFTVRRFVVADSRTGEGGIAYRPARAPPVWAIRNYQLYL
jgi:hypothetical protein